MSEFFGRHWLHLLPVIPMIILIAVDVAGRRRGKDASIAQPNTSLKVVPYVRRLVYSFSLLWLIILYYIAATSFPTISTSLTALHRYFGFTALTLLYIVLLPGIIKVYFPKYFLNPLLIKSRRALGISLFAYALLHGLLGFINNLSGDLTAIFYLSPRNQLGILFGLTALIIFFLMTITSFDSVIRSLKPQRWKMLHRLIYIAGILVIFHAFFIGSHFTNTKAFIPLLVNFATLTIIFLEVGATFKKLSQQRENISEMRYTGTWLLLSCVMLAALYFSFRGITENVFDPHAEHRMANISNSLGITTIPSTITPNMPVTIRMKIADREGNPITQFQIVHEKLLHLIVLSSDLTQYQHVHPNFDGETFTQTLTFPQEGVYKLYAEYLPNASTNAISVTEVQTEYGTPIPANLSVSSLTKEVDNYIVELSSENAVTKRKNHFTFTIRDKNSGRPVRDLEPYLGSFGHLVVVSEDTESYLHVHPVESIVDARQRGGPEVRFQTTFQKKGFHKLFLQFQQNGKVQLVDFVVDVT